MSEAITVARPYAQAAFEEAQKQADLKSWSELLQAGADAIANPEVEALVSNPSATTAQLEGLMLALTGAKAGSAQANLVCLLVENKRLLQLPQISEQYEALRAEAEQSVDVVVTSAFDLSAAQQDKIAVALKNRFRRDIRLSCEINPSLLGGVVIRAGDKVIDGSARTRLGEMATALA